MFLIFHQTFSLLLSHYYRPQEQCCIDTGLESTKVGIEYSGYLYTAPLKTVINLISGTNWSKCKNSLSRLIIFETVLVGRHEDCGADPKIVQ